MANERSPMQCPTDETIIKTYNPVFCKLFMELSSSVHNMIQMKWEYPYIAIKMFNASR